MYKHPGYNKKFLDSHEDRTWVLRNLKLLLYPWTRALNLLLTKCLANREIRYGIYLMFFEITVVKLLFTILSGKLAES